MNIAELLSRQAAVRPQTTAIIDTQNGQPRLTSYAELEQATTRAADVLYRAGLRMGDRVLVFVPLQMELYALLGAIFRLGLTAVFLDPSAGRTRLEACCAQAQPRALIVSNRAQFLRLISPALRRIPHCFALGRLMLGLLPILNKWVADTPRSVELAPEAAALLTFTSGSTGEPKALVRSHGFLRVQHRVLAESLALGPGVIDLTTLPIFGLANLASGATSVIPNADLRRPGQIRPEPVIRQIERHGVNRITAAPGLLEQLIDGCRRQGLKLNRVRHVYSGGAPIFPRLLDDLAAVMPAAAITALYGSSEAEPIAELTLPAISAADRQAMASGGGLLAGYPVASCAVRVITDAWGQPRGPYSAAEFARCCLPPGEVGEIVVSGAHVLNGYVDPRADAAIKLRVEGEVWHRTGDAGYFDAAGRLWLMGRCAARIGAGPGAIYPLAVEGAASQYGAVRRSALVEQDGQRLLVIEPAHPSARVELEEVRRNLAGRIDEVRLVRRLPVDQRHNAKIDYPRLRRLLAE
jgi:acyl-CoA synthetase (AMP-forming)/AMP-acid ligase II